MHRQHECIMPPAQILGRGDNIKAFIKHGTSEAMTEVTLSSGNPARPVVIRRSYQRDGTSQWKINGEGLHPPSTCPSSWRASAATAQGTPAACTDQVVPDRARTCLLHAAGAQKTQREAKEIMKDMNVQLDNLCQVS